MRVTRRRGIRSREAAVVRTTLERASTLDKCRGLIAQVEALRVVGGCECGCDSVDFEPNGQAPPAQIIADAIGTTPVGGQVGVLIWGSEERIGSLEIYDLGAGDEDLRLPSIESIEPWGSKS